MSLALAHGWWRHPATALIAALVHSDAVKIRRDNTRGPRPFPFPAPGRPCAARIMPRDHAPALRFQFSQAFCDSRRRASGKQLQQVNAPPLLCCELGLGARVTCTEMQQCKQPE